MQKSNHICYNTSKYACFKPYNTYTNSMLKYCKKVVKKACNLQHYYNRVKTLDCTAFYMVEYAGFKWFYWKRNILLDDNEQHIELSYH